METTATTAETVQPADSDNIPDNAEAAPAWAILLAGLTAMILIYAVTVLLPRIAAAVDRLFGRAVGEEQLPNAEDYKVRDIYEGEDEEDK